MHARSHGYYRCLLFSFVFVPRQATLLSPDDDVIALIYLPPVVIVPPQSHAACVIKLNYRAAVNTRRGIRILERRGSGRDSRSSVDDPIGRIKVTGIYTPHACQTRRSRRSRNEETFSYCCNVTQQRTRGRVCDNTRAMSISASFGGERVRGSIDTRR